MIGIESPNTPTGRRLSYITFGLTMAVALGTLWYLHHQMKLVKIQIKEHDPVPKIAEPKGH